MIQKIKRLLGIESKGDAFMRHLVELERETPNNYQFGSLLRGKIKSYKRGEIDLNKNKRNFSH